MNQTIKFLFKASILLLFLQSPVHANRNALKETSMGVEVYTKMPGGKIQLQNGFLTVGTGFVPLGTVADVSGIRDIVPSVLDVISGKTIVTKAWIASISAEPLLGPSYFSNYNIGSTEYLIDGVPYFIVSLATSGSTTKPRPLPAPTWAVGNFSLFFTTVQNTQNILLGMGIYGNIMTNSKGSITGYLLVGGKRYAFRSQLINSEEGDESRASISVILSRSPLQVITMDLKFSPDEVSGILALGNESVALSSGWRQNWNAKSNPAFGNRDRILHASIESIAHDAPQGYGFAKIRLSRDGVATWAVTLADGQRVSGSFPVSDFEEIPFYAPIRYAGSGSVLALLETETRGGLYQIISDIDLNGVNGRWTKSPAANAKSPDLSYSDGFDSDLEVSGAEFVTPAPGNILFGNPSSSPGFELFLTGGGIESSSQIPNDGVAALEATLLANNRLAISPPSATLGNLRITLQFKWTSGDLSGRLSLLDANPFGSKAILRQLTYAGLYIPNLSAPEASEIRGFFILPSLPSEPGMKTNQTPVASGKLELVIQ